MKHQNSMQILKGLQAPNGLFLAAPAPGTGYNKVWIRDNIYASLGLETVHPEAVVEVYHKLFDIMNKHEYKIAWAIKEKPKHAYQYIHARYHPETLEEFYEHWGNKQNDAVGAFLFKVADLKSKGLNVIRDVKDLEILNLLVRYLESIEYWHDSDNGMWEEYEEVHASSVGACVAGLKAISKFIPVPEELIENGKRVLDALLPRESETKETDLALLSLIYPYNIVSEKQRDEILNNVEEKLARERGVIRYTGDQYYNKNGEAEWTMGFPWLAIIYRQLGNKERYKEYMQKSLDVINEKGEFPELYYSNSEEHNDNSPLGWAQSLYIVAAI